jgi:hypothetical protein
MSLPGLPTASTISTETFNYNRCNDLCRPAAQAPRHGDPIFHRLSGVTSDKRTWPLRWLTIMMLKKKPQGVHAQIRRCALATFPTYGPGTGQITLVDCVPDNSEWLLFENALRWTNAAWCLVWLKTAILVHDRGPCRAAATIHHCNGY